MQLLKSAKKFQGQLAELPSSAISMGVLVIVVAMVVLILVGMNGSTTEAAANDIITEGITGISVYGDWFNTLVLVVIGIVVLGLVMGFFYIRSKRGGGRA